MCSKFLCKVELCIELHIESNQAFWLACQIYAKTQFLVLLIGYSFYYFIFFIYLTITYLLFLYLRPLDGTFNVSLHATLYFLLWTSSPRSLDCLVKVEKKSEIVIS